MRHRAAGIDDGPVLPDLGPEWLLTERLERERLLFDTGFTPRLAAADGVDAGLRERLRMAADQTATAAPQVMYRPRNVFVTF